MYTTLISTHDVEQNLNHPDWVFIDCRFHLNDTEKGHRDYQISHLPNAIYAHLDNDLSGPIMPQKTGRHPLPSVETLSQTLSSWGIDGSVQVVVYDDMNGAIASRLWWMLHWVGHDHVAVLDGSWQLWQKENRPISAEILSPSKRAFRVELRPHLLVDVATVSKVSEDTSMRLFDSRSADRYRGENETIDPVAGHIPSAVSAPFIENMGDDGKMRSQEALRERFNGLLQSTGSSQTIFYCGSGVTACHNLLALNHSGLGDGKLYAGSWSEWITDPNRPNGIV